MDTKANRPIALAAYCKWHDVDPKRAARYARKGLFGDAYKILGKWAVPVNMPLPALPQIDPYPGRDRYFIWATEAEFERMQEDDCRVMGGAELHALNAVEARTLQDAQALAEEFGWLIRILRRIGWRSSSQ